jgi:RND family efflux transporter MFP subunit
MKPCATFALLLAGVVAPCHAQPRTFDCLIEATQMVDIRSPVEGLIESIAVRRGDSVRKGQVLVTLQSGAEKAAADSARARSQAVGELQAAQAKLQNAERKEARNVDLAKQNFVSAAAVDDAKAERELAQSQLTAAKEALRIADHEHKRATEVLQLRQLRSPLDGVVVKRFLHPGEFAATNVKEPILRLAQINPLHVEVLLPAEQFRSVRLGAKAWVIPETGGSGREATVSVVDRVIDGASGTFGVRLVLPNADGAIPAGAKCSVRFAQ